MLSEEFLAKNTIYELQKIAVYLKSYFNEVPKTKNILIKGMIADAKNPEFLNRKSNYYYFQLVQDNYSIGCLISYFYLNVINDIYKGNGKEFILFGSLSYYEKSNNISFFVNDCAEFGKSKKEQEKERIFKLIAQNNWYSKQRPIPTFVKTVGVVTASGHAAEKDIYTIIKKNNPFCEIVYYHSLVQGENAPKDIADKINQANLECKCEVLIIGRGGGGSQDLDAFNSLLVVEAVAKSKIITISAVGHATDVVIIDQVADHSAKTPSDAASMVTTSLITYLDSKVQTIKRDLENSINLRINHLTTLYNNAYQLLLMSSPFKKVIATADQFNILLSNLHRYINYRLNNFTTKLYQVVKNLHSPIALFDSAFSKITHIKSNLHFYINSIISKQNNQVAICKNQLIGNSPKRILEMGYAKLHSLAGVDITSVKQINLNDEYNLVFADGSASIKVIKINKEKKNE